MISYLLLSHCWLLNILPAQNAPQVIGLGQNSHIAVTTSNNQTGRVGENTLSTEGFTPNDNKF